MFKQNISAFEYLGTDYPILTTKATYLSMLSLFKTIYKNTVFGRGSTASALTNSLEFAQFLAGKGVSESANADISVLVKFSVEKGKLRDSLSLPKLSAKESDFDYVVHVRIERLKEKVLAPVQTDNQVYFFYNKDYYVATISAEDAD